MGFVACLLTDTGMAAPAEEALVVPAVDAEPEVFVALAEFAELEVLVALAVFAELEVLVALAEPVEPLTVLVLAVLLALLLLVSVLPHPLSAAALTRMKVRKSERPRVTTLIVVICDSPLR